MSFLGSVIGGIGSLVGGMFGADAAKKGSKASAKAMGKANAANLEYQKQFASNAVQWKVRDALRAGIHPIAALGANTVSFQPSFVGEDRGAGIAAAGAAMGQGIGRASEAFGDAFDRQDGFAKKLMQLQLENATLQNAKLASEIALTTQAGTPPAAPVSAPNRYLIPGQGQSVSGPSPLVVDQSMQRTSSDPDRLSNEPGSIPSVGFQRTSGGGWVPVQTKDAADRSDDLGEVDHYIRNRIAQPLTSIDSGAPFRAPPGQRWAYSLLDGYVLVPNNSGGDKDAADGFRY